MNKKMLFDGLDNIESFHYPGQLYYQAVPPIQTTLIPELKQYFPKVLIDLILKLTSSVWFYPLSNDYVTCYENIITTVDKKKLSTTIGPCMRYHPAIFTISQYPIGFNNNIQTTIHTQILVTTNPTETSHEYFAFGFINPLTKKCYLVDERLSTLFYQSYNFTYPVVDNFPHRPYIDNSTEWIRQQLGSYYSRHNTWSFKIDMELDFINNRVTWMDNTVLFDFGDCDKLCLLHWVVALWGPNTSLSLDFV